MVDSPRLPDPEHEIHDDDAPALGLTYTDAGDPVPGDDHLSANLADLRAGVSVAADVRGAARARGAEMPDTALSWLGSVHESTRLAAVEITRAADAAGLGLELVWGMSATGEHHAGYSADYMTWSRAGTDHDPRIGDYVARYVWAHRWHLALRYLIWDRRIRNVSIDKGKWRPYSGESTHTDHVHVCRLPRSYPAGWWHAVPPVSRAALNAALARPAVSLAPSNVEQLQRALNVILGAGLVRDGSPGPLTRAALVRFQKQTRSPATGTISSTDARRLSTASGTIRIGP